MKPPTPVSLQEVIGKLTERLSRLERRTFVEIGPWRLSTDATGNLVATHMPSGDVRTVAIV